LTSLCQSFYIYTSALHFPGPEGDGTSFKPMSGHRQRFCVILTIRPEHPAQLFGYLRGEKISEFHQQGTLFLQRRNDSSVNRGFVGVRQDSNHLAR